MTQQNRPELDALQFETSVDSFLISTVASQQKSQGSENSEKLQPPPPFATLPAATNIMTTAGATPSDLFFFFFYCFICCCIFLLCMTAKGGTSRPACAACKHQRRKCTADCPLALYFPADQPKQFRNAHRLFGVSNILRILKDLDPVQKSEAMKSILYEANVREHYPTNGCIGLITSLQVKIHQLLFELENINRQIAMYQSDQHQYYHSTHLQLAPSSSSTPQSPLPPTIDNLNMRISDPDLTNYDENNEMRFVDPMWENQTYTNNITDGNSVNTATRVQQPFEAVTDTIEQEYDVISPYFDTIDEEKTYESRQDQFRTHTLVRTHSYMYTESR